MLTALDPPRHTALRRHTAPLFTVRAVADLRPAAVSLLDALLDAALTAGPGVNFSEAVANPYLSRLVGGLMGIPEADLPRIKDGATAASLAMAGDISDAVTGRLGGFTDYFESFVTGWKDERHSDDPARGAFTRRLFEPGADGRPLDHVERVSYETLLATGGNETTAQLLSNLTLTLSEQPGVLDRLRRDPSLRPSAVEESLRYISPVTGLFRHTTEEVELHGITVPVDAKVLMMYGSANHDDRHYSDPDSFVIDRFPRGFADADHLAFTTGIHVCLGAHLARLLIEVFLDRMSQRIGAIEVTGPVCRSTNALVRVIDNLPVRLAAR